MAVLLGYSPRNVAYIVYGISPSAKYTKIDVPKKRGGSREVWAPEPKLKGLQRRLANLLYDCRDELQAASPHSPLSFGYRRRLSIVDNARRHSRRRFVLNVDLKDFFPTVNFGRVRGYFINNQNFQLHPSVATLLAQIACHNHVLPQGSPCSPIIADLIAGYLDGRLVTLAKAHSLTYSRYVDDITFSTSKKEFPEEVAILLTSTTGVSPSWLPGRELRACITNSGFELNLAKTRMQFRGSQQSVTGLVVNEKVNIDQSYYRRVRSMCHALFRSGSYYVGHKSAPIGPPVPTTNKQRLEGILSYIAWVKSRGSEPLPSVEAKSAKKERHGVRKLYSKFLFYDVFVAPELPVVICEGKTDNVYLRAAIRSLAAKFPDLYERSGGGSHFKLKFFRYSARTLDLLDLSGGSGDLSALISRYDREVRSYLHRPMLKPVILVVDSDKGLEAITKVANKQFGLKIDPALPTQFWHLAHNLFVVTVPLVGGKAECAIEDLFPPVLLSTKLDGKSLSLDDKFDTTKFYGKAYFAEHVVAKNASSISFVGFEPLLARISAVLKAH